MHQLPQTGYFRLTQILGNKKSNPPVIPLIPIGKSAWWEGVKIGRFPQPIKLGPRITVWRVEDIISLIQHGPIKPTSPTQKHGQEDTKDGV